MSENEVQRQVREQLGLRVGPEMAAYLLRRLGTADKVPVIAADARTGVPVRIDVAPESLRIADSATTAPNPSLA